MGIKAQNSPITQYEILLHLQLCVKAKPIYKRRFYTDMAFRVGILAVIGGILISIMIGVYAFDQAKTASKMLEEILESVAPKAGPV